MSFDIFFQCFRNGEVATFKRAIFEEIFGPYVTSREPNFVRIKWPNNSAGAQTYIDDKEDISSICFNRPGGDALFEALFILADRTKSVIYWPGEGSSAVVTDAAILAHLPPALIQIDKPIVVAGWRDIDNAIAASG